MFSKSIEEKGERIKNGTYVPLLSGALFSVGYTLAVCALGIALPYVYLKNVTVFELMIVPVTFILANFLEYAVHRWPMHHAYRRFEILQVLHMHHHHYFALNQYRLRGVRDMDMVVFPPLVLTVIALGPVCIGGILIGIIWSMNAALLWCMTVFLYYLVMQVIHVMCHVEEHHPLLRLPMLQYLWNHHRIHHTKEYMLTKNFNFIVPIADFFFKTATQERFLDTSSGQ